MPGVTGDRSELKFEHTDFCEAVKGYAKVSLLSFLSSEPISPLKNHSAGEANQTSDGSSVAFRPVPKKRTFLSRLPRSHSESNGLGSDAHTGSAGIAPTPRQRLQRGSSGSSNQSGLKSQDEIPQRSGVSNQVAQSSTSADENSLQSPCDVFQISSNSSLERQRKPPSLTRDRSVESLYPEPVIKLHPSSVTCIVPCVYRLGRYTRSDAPTEAGTLQWSEERDNQAQREHPSLNFITPPTSNSQDRENSRAGAAMRQEELSVAQNTVGKFSNKTYLVQSILRHHFSVGRSF